MVHRDLLRLARPKPDTTDAMPSTTGDPGGDGRLRPAMLDIAQLIVRRLTGPEEVRAARLHPIKVLVAQVHGQDRDPAC